MKVCSKARGRNNAVDKPSDWLPSIFAGLYTPPTQAESLRSLWCASDADFDSKWYEDIYSV